MFEDYLQDAYEFLLLARKESTSLHDREARRYYRATVFYTAGAIEAFVNYIADSLAKANTLPTHEIAFLNDKNWIFSPEKGMLVERVEWHKLDDKLRVLIRRFSPTFDLSGRA